MNALLPHVLHLVSARGGGMTRFARDLAACGEGHALLHVGEDTWVLETCPSAAPGASGLRPDAFASRSQGPREADRAPDRLDATPGRDARFAPYRVPDDAGEAADWLDALLAVVGARWLHVHFLDARTLAVLEAWSARGRAWMCSLHDLGFLRADAFAGDAAQPLADPAWSGRWRVLLERAAVITAPSRFLANAFEDACPGLPVHVVAPGVDAPAPPPRSARPLRSLAIVGALGAHKGKQRLLDWLLHPGAAGFRWTLVGYTEDQLHPGRIAGGRLRVHGPFEPQDTARWLRHHDVDLVLFPNRLAESFSYALSDVWAAGVPVLVPDFGALGERVRACGGGSLLSDADDADALIAQLQGLRDGVQLARWRHQIEAGRARMVPTVTQMLEAMADCQAPFGVDAPRAAMAASAALSRLQPWLRTQLDDTAFRHENIRLARDYAQVRGWAEKLESDLARLGADARAQSAARGELEHRLRERDRDIESLRARNAQVEADAAALHARNAVVEADAAELARAAAVHAGESARQAAHIAELNAHSGALSRQLDEARRTAAELGQRCADQNLELATMHQRINALDEELRPLRVKGARYDRVRGWLPAPLLELARGLLQLRRLRLRTRAVR